MKHDLTVLNRIIIIMFIPFFISFTILNSTKYLLLLVGFAYLVQCLLLTLKFPIKKYNMKILITSVCLILIQLLTLCSNVILRIDTNSFDYINAIAKTVNFFLLFGAMKSIISTDAQIKYFMKVFFVFILIACFYNFFVNCTKILNLMHISSSYEVNFRSFFPNRNQFGMVLFLAAVAHHYMGFSHKRSYLLHIFIIINLILTMSRGAMLATAVFYVLLYAQSARNYKVNISLISFLTLAMIILISNARITTFVSRYLIRADIGLTGRTDVWKMGLDVYFQNNIVNGVGFNTGVDIAKAAGFQHSQFHSFFIDTLVSGGLFEFIFIIATLIYVYRRCVNLCQDLYFIRIYRASVAAIFVLSFFESVSFYSIGFVDTTYTIFFVTIPILMSNMIVSKQAVSELTGPRRDSA